jgi:hypothetical protein
MIAFCDEVGETVHLPEELRLHAIDVLSYPEASYYNFMPLYTVMPMENSLVKIS